MKIKEVTAKNFRTLEDFRTEFKNIFCTISGQNNAGKTGVVSIIRHFLDEGETRYRMFDNAISFQKDFTQWATEKVMEISITIEMSRSDDTEVFFVIEKFSSTPITEDVAQVRLTEKFDEDGSKTTLCCVNGKDLDTQSSSEVFKKIKTALNLVVHNSTNPEKQMYYFSGEMTEVLAAHFSKEDREKISKAKVALSNSIKTAAKAHKEELGELLGKLGENYNVELTTLDSGNSSRFPLNVSLNDKSVDVNLSGWGSGTQNRTRVLMSVLEAERIRKSQSAENRSTPVVIIEEPESFLHPSAQAEFGKVLNDLASDFKIQIIATTHSPYMLNQKDPEANILMKRKVTRSKLKETVQVASSGDDWMIPFAENLGVASDEFIPWEKIVTTQSNRVLLVEGSLDVQYFEAIKEKFPALYSLPDDVDVVSYDGVGALSNTHLLKFMISRLDRVFITFDLDAKDSVSKKLTSIGLAEDADFCAIGVEGAGKDCIEGLLPMSFMSNIYAKNVEAVTALGSADKEAIRAAKRKIKQACIDGFHAEQLTEKDLFEFKKLIAKISKAFK
jgi:putative ATP-dependent endonuclease of OLD family